MSSRRLKPDEKTASKNPPPSVSGSTSAKNRLKNVGGSSGAFASGSGAPGSSMSDQLRNDQGLEDLRINSLLVQQDQAEGSASRNIHQREMQMAALTKTMDLCKKEALSAADILFQRAALTSEEVALVLKHRRLDLQQHGWMVLDKAKEKHDAAAAEFNKLRLTMTSEDKAQQFEKKCLEYKKNNDKNDKDIPENNPDDELKKFVANPMYLPKFPSKFMNKWENLEKWMAVYQKFLKIVMAQLVPPEEWANVQIDEWAWMAGAVRPPGKIRCQEMLQTYLLPFLAMEGNKKAILTLNDIETFHPNQWDSFIAAINDKKNSKFIEQSKTPVGVKSHYPFYFVGILKCFYVRKSMGLPLTHVPDGGAIASSTDDVQELNIGNMKKAVWEAVKNTVLEELAKHDELPEISFGVNSFGGDQGVAPTDWVSGIQGGVQIETAVTIQPAAEPVTAASQATSSTARSISLDPANESASSSDQEESPSVVNAVKRGKFATATKGGGPGKTAGVPEKAKRYAATAVKVAAPRNLKSAFRKAAADDGQ